MINQNCDGNIGVSMVRFINKLNDTEVHIESNQISKVEISGLAHTAYQKPSQHIKAAAEYKLRREF